MTEQTVSIDGVDLCFETFGDPAGATVTLIAGGAQSMVWWEEGFCSRLAGAGRHVIRYDHREGLSALSTFAFIHGAGVGGGWYWHLVEAELRALGHTTVAPTLWTGDDAATLSDYADAVVDGIDTIDTQEELFVVAHSFGGFTAPRPRPQPPKRTRSHAPRIHIPTIATNLAESGIRHWIGDADRRE